jgi:hypothetical protein
MPAPYNYAPNIPDPTAAFTQSFNFAAGIRQQQQAQEEQARAVERQAQVQQLYAKVQGPNATGADYAALAMALPPEQAKSVRESFAMRTEEQNRASLGAAGQIYSAFQSDRPEIAMTLIEQQIEAKRNSGDEAGARYLETWRDVAKVDPNAAKVNFGFVMSQIPGGDKVIDGAVKLSEEQRDAARAPAELRKAEAEALKAATDAKFAESEAVAGLNLKQAQIRNLAMQPQIAAANLAIARETNALKREELIIARDQKVQGLAADYQGALDNADRLLNTVDGLLNTPANVIESATGPISSRFVPTFDQDTADFEEAVEGLKSQAFLSQVAQIKGMGALSNAEGEKLSAALGNLSLRQSRARLVANLQEIQRLTLKGRRNLETRYGVRAPPPDRPNVKPPERVVQY